MLLLGSSAETRGTERVAAGEGRWEVEEAEADRALKVVLRQAGLGRRVGSAGRHGGCE
jgi:hypothetical protein